jgi:adenosylcobinamide-GDP ribazoletransferase
MCLTPPCSASSAGPMAVLQRALVSLGCRPLRGTVDVFFRSARIALQFLTCFPISLEPPPAGREVGLSLLWYPAVGLLLGLLLWSAAVLLSPVPIPLAASIMVAVWVFSTGALHLDGLADTVDAWAGGRGERERTLAIMKDPYSGPIGIAAVVCLLLLKFGALSALLFTRRSGVWGETQFACAFILPPTLARSAVPLLFAQTPYVRVQGIGADLTQYQSRAGAWVTATVISLAAITFGGWCGLLATAVTAATYLIMRRAFIRRLGGLTGDCAGAMVEVIETFTVVALALSASA